MSKKYAFCALCNRNIDVTNQRFCDNDEMPIVLSAQLDSDTEEEAVKLAVKLNDIQHEDYCDDSGALRMYQYDHMTVSHKDYDDENAEKHHLQSRYWSFQ
jgi:hypothetical protein